MAYHVTKSGRVWRKVPDSDARSVILCPSLTSLMVSVDVTHCERRRAQVQQRKDVGPMTLRSGPRARCMRLTGESERSTRLWTGRDTGIGLHNPPTTTNRLIFAYLTRTTITLVKPYSQHRYPHQHPHQHHHHESYPHQTFH